MMYCKKCGAQLSDDVVFCPYCGAKTDVNQPSVSSAYSTAVQNQNPPQNPAFLKSPKKIRIFMAVWFVIMLITNAYAISNAYTSSLDMMGDGSFGGLVFGSVDSFSGWVFLVLLIIFAIRVRDIYQYLNEKGTLPKVIYWISSILGYFILYYFLLMTIYPLTAAFDATLFWLSTAICWINYEVAYHKTQI